MKGAVADAGRDGGGNLARKVLDVLIRRISPLLVLLPQDASETVERCMEVVAEVELKNLPPGLKRRAAMSSGSGSASLE